MKKELSEVSEKRTVRGNVKGLYGSCFGNLKRGYTEEYFQWLKDITVTRKEQLKEKQKLSERLEKPPEGCKVVKPTVRLF